MPALSTSRFLFAVFLIACSPLAAIASDASTAGRPAAEEHAAVSTAGAEGVGMFNPFVKLTVNTNTINETGGVAIFTATLVDAFDAPFLALANTTVELAFSGTAVRNTDYTMSTVSIVIPIGFSSGTATLTTIDDVFEEDNETAIVRIHTVSGGTAVEAGVQSQTVTINDFDSNALLSLTKTVDAPVGNLPGELVTFTLTVTNSGSTTANDVVVTDPLPAQFDCTCSPVASEGDFDYTGGVITWDNIDLATGESATLTFTATIDVVPPALLTNTASIVSSVPADPITADNSASATVDVPLEANFPAGVQINDIAFSEDDGGDPIIVTGTINFGAYRGVTGQFPGEFFWLPASNGFDIPQYVTDVLRLVSGDLLMATWGRAGLYRSDRNGRLWSPVDVRDPDITIVHAIAQSPIDGTIYISADDGQVFRSIDDGATWVFMGRLPGGAADYPSALVVDPNDDAIIYAGTFGNGVKVSMNRGKNWVDVGGNATLLGANAGHVFDLAFDPTGDFLFAGTGRGTWRSADGGGTWSLLDPSLLFGGGNPPEVRSVAFNAAGDLYIATWGNGVWVNAAPTAAGTFGTYALRGEYIFTVAINDQTGDVFMASQDSGMHVALASAVANEAPAEVPGEFVLEGNYPNPFNPETTIRFALPQSGNVRLSVFDMLGREVAVLMDGVVETGWHDVRFDASKLTSGAYLYRLQTAQGTASRVLTLLK